MLLYKNNFGQQIHFWTFVSFSILFSFASKLSAQTWYDLMPHACYLALKFAASFIFLGILLTGNNLTLHTPVVWCYQLITIDSFIIKTGYYCYSNNNYVYWQLGFVTIRYWDCHIRHGTKKDLSHETLNNVPATTDLNMRKRKHSTWVAWK